MMNKVLSKQRVETVMTNFLGWKLVPDANRQGGHKIWVHGNGIPVQTRVVSDYIYGVAYTCYQTVLNEDDWAQFVSSWGDQVIRSELIRRKVSYHVGYSYMTGRFEASIYPVSKDRVVSEFQAVRDDSDVQSLIEVVLTACEQGVWS